ncbi:hypothetical protein CAPNMURICA_23 [Arthrobacter phage CapnMurica]|uniref:Minor tail protein n=1 Tax=Arthrobacter phage CapnMurica TaxID=1772294 RepID=A0A0U4IK91_9CAUD|nr:minor tail protein [Arthrobacter phage CaptnMurica]ALY08623.1 hypothetical protein CAPNMURICA_23 [Arthrobacter phage CaptnMurica]
MAQTPDDPTKAQVWITKGIDDLDFEFYFPQGPKGDPGGIVQGTVLNADTNMNEILADGRYRVAGVTLVNGPPAAQMYGSFDVISSQGSARIIQTFYPQASGEGGRVIYQRILAGGVWYGWYAFNSTRVSNVAGRAFYQWDNVAGRDQLIYGDTGVRTLALDNNYLGTLQIRRLGNQVYLSGAVKRPVGGSINGTFLTALPDGFKPQTAAWTFFPVRHSPTPNWGTLYRKAYELAFEGLTGDTDAGEARFEISWTTVQAWPTVLPGSASGSIPNI